MKYRYEKLCAMCYHAKDFAIDQMREAVEYLKTQPQTEFTGLQGTTTRAKRNGRKDSRLRIGPQR